MFITTEASVLIRSRALFALLLEAQSVLKTQSVHPANTLAGKSIGLAQRSVLLHSPSTKTSREG